LTLVIESVFSAMRYMPDNICQCSEAFSTAAFLFFE